MPTRARIGLKHPDGSIESISVFFDGYPSYAGRRLRDHWSTTQKVARLVALGNLAMLGEKIGKKHSFGAHMNKPRDPRWGDQCLAYGRDRGEKSQAALRSPTELELEQLLRRSDQEYVYLWDGKEEKWTFSAVPRGTSGSFHWRTLTAADVAERKSNPSEKTPTRVVFRKWPKSEGGGVIALLLDVDANPGHVESFMHAGGHSEATFEIVRRTKPATASEYKALARELTTYPYNYKLEVVQRVAHAFSRLR